MASSVLARMAVFLSANAAQFLSQMSAASKSMSGFSSTVLSAGKVLGATFGAYQVFNGVKAGIEIIAEFEKQMSIVKAVTQATSAEFNKLEQSALQLGRTTQFTSSQVAGLQIEFGRLGFSTKEILNSTKATINLATATGENLSRSAEIAGSTLRAFQLDASQMGRVTDVMASSFNKSALALDSFADGIKYVAPVAKVTNVTLEETTAMLSVLADAGIKGSQAGTSLRRIFTMLTKDGKPLTERLQELSDKGIKLADANDEVGIYAQTALLVLSAQNEKIKELTQTYREANGEALKTADVVRDNLDGDFQKLNATVTDSILKFKIFIPLMRAVVQAANDYVKGPNILEESEKAFKDLGVTQIKRMGEAIMDDTFQMESFMKAIKDFEGNTNLDLTEKQFTEIAKQLGLSEVQARKLRGAIFDLGGIVGGTRDLEAPEPSATAGTGGMPKKQARTISFLKDEIKRVQEQMENTVDSGAIQRFKEEIRLLNEEIEMLIGASYNGARAMYLLQQSLMGPQKTPFEKATAAPDNPFSNPQGVEFLSKAYRSLGDSVEYMAAKMKKAQEEQNKFAKSQEEVLVGQLRMLDNVGNSISAAIAHGEDWQESFARVAVSIIDNLQAIALSWVVANAAKMANPFLIGAAIIAGTALIKGAFGSIARGRSSGGGGGTQVNRRAADNMEPQVVNINVTGEFALRGNTLIAAIDKAGYVKTRTG